MPGCRPRRERRRSGVHSELKRVADRAGFRHRDCRVRATKCPLESVWIKLPCRWRVEDPPIVLLTTAYCFPGEKCGLAICQGQFLALFSMIHCGNGLIEEQ